MKDNLRIKSVTHDAGTVYITIGTRFDGKGRFDWETFYMTIQQAVELAKAIERAVPGGL